MHVDKIHVSFKIIDNNGNVELLFLGVKEPKELDVKGIMQAIKDGCDKLF